jgi:hypothetical protein
MYSARFIQNFHNNVSNFARVDKYSHMVITGGTGTAFVGMEV